MKDGISVSENSALRPFADNGFTIDGMSDRQILLILLNDILGRERYDNEKLADLMLATFKTVSGAVHASAAALDKLGVLREDDIVRLCQIGAAHRYIMREECRLPIKLSDKEGLFRLLKAVFFERHEELLYVFPVVKGKIISEYLIDGGSDDSVNLSVMRIKTRLESVTGCESFILAHNHPDGCTEPSEQDLIATGAVCSMLGGDGYKLLAHYIYTSIGVTEIPLDKAHASYFFRN